MLNENQISDLERKLLDIGNLVSVSKGIDKSTSSKRGHLYENAAMIIAGPRVIGEGKDARENKAYTDLIEEMRYSPEYAQMQINGAVNIRSEEIKKEVEDSKDKLLETIANSINSNLDKAKNKSEAAEILKLYLNDLIDIKDPSQEEADETVNDEFRMKLRIPYSFDRKGSISQYKELMLRSVASEFLAEKGEGSNKKYELDVSKIKDSIKEVVGIAKLYTNTKFVEKNYKPKEE